MRDERDHSPRDLSISCSLNEPAVRYHLRKLTGLGIIQKSQNSEVTFKPGRKPDVYRLSSRRDLQTTLLLCRSLLTFIESSLSYEESAKTLADWFLSSTGEYNKNNALSIQDIVTWLNKNHYAACWEAGRTGPELIINNCPYRDLHVDSDLLCRMDKQLLSQLSGKSWMKLDEYTSIAMRKKCRFVLIS
jgi:predicted ArsR family transcriptional regulator